MELLQVYRLDKLPILIDEIILGYSEQDYAKELNTIQGLELVLF